MKIAVELSSLDCARLKKLAERSGKTVEACASFLIAGGVYTSFFGDEVYTPETREAADERA